MAQSRRIRAVRPICVVVREGGRYSQCMNRLYTIILTIGITSVLAHAADLTITVKGVRVRMALFFLRYMTATRAS
jgi:hypothetical protein